MVMQSQFLNIPAFHKIVIAFTPIIISIMVNIIITTIIIFISILVNIIIIFILLNTFMYICFQS